MVADGAIKIPIKRPAPAEAGSAAEAGDAAEGQYLRSHVRLPVVVVGLLLLRRADRGARKDAAGVRADLAHVSSRRADVNKWGVSEPLDAIVYASAAALAFILLETLFGNSYVGAALQGAREKGTLATQALPVVPAGDHAAR